MLKVADVATWNLVSEMRYLVPRSRAHLRVLEASRFSLLKYAFSHILENLFSFDI